jgi:hypothetical protein
MASLRLNAVGINTMKGKQRSRNTSGLYKLIGNAGYLKQLLKKLTKLKYLATGN